MMDDFREQCRRQMDRSLEQRLKYGFFKQYKAVLDDARFRTFDTMKEYREWADKNLPRYLGYRIAKKKENNKESLYEKCPQ